MAHDCKGLESMTIMAGNVTSEGRHEARDVAEIFHLIHKHKEERQS